MRKRMIKSGRKIVRRSNHVIGDMIDLFRWKKIYPKGAKLLFGFLGYIKNNKAIGEKYE
jgi:hypothetical protein